ncbi:hypothetical protein FF1_007715 [Malus domestica]
MEQNFDTAVGSIAMLAKRYLYAEFTAPYTESRLVMIVSCRARTLVIHQAFHKCHVGFDRSHKSLQWICDIWLIERNHCPELKGSIQNQIGIWLAFNPLFSLNGKQVKQQFVADFNGPVALRNKLSSNLSRIAMVMWLFMALVITQTYTANLASLLTLPQLEPVATVVVALHDAFINISIGFLSQMVIEIDSHHQDGL